MRDSVAHEKNERQAVSVLAVFRFAASMTQEELARRAHVTRETVGALEAGRHQPRRLTAESIASALGVEPSILWPRNDNGRACNAAEVTTTAGQGRDGSAG